MLSALLDFLARARVAHCRRAPDAAHASLISHKRADASDLDEDSPTAARCHPPPVASREASSPRRERQSQRVRAGVGP